MNKREVVAEVAARTQREPADVAEVVDVLVDVIVRTVAAGDRVAIQDFGAFFRQARAKRVGRDISLGQAVAVPATHVPAFRAGKGFRELVAAPRRRRTAAVAGRRRRAIGRSAALGRSGSTGRSRTGDSRSETTRRQTGARRAT